MLYGGLILGKAGVVHKLVRMQLRIRVGVGSIRVKILGGRKIRWGESSCWGKGRGGCCGQ